MFRSFLAMAPTSLLAIGFLACSSDDTAAPSSPPSTTSTVSFASDVMPIFQQNCSVSGASCHGDPSVVSDSVSGARPYFGPATPAALPAKGSPTAAAILAGLVGATSAEDPKMPRITAGDSSKSFLMYKMDFNFDMLTADCAGGDLGAAQGCGLVMPYTTGALDQTTRDTVRAWINAGAKNN